MRAVLKKSALLSTLFATIETFKKESYLILLGHQRKQDFVIEQAIALQTAKRKFTGVETTTNIEQLVLNLNEFFFKNSQPIGDCHSHTERKESHKKTRYPVEPSLHDIQGSEKNKVYVIVSISKKKKTQVWKKTKIGGIIGTLGDHRFEIRAYWAPEDKKLEQIPLICPSAYKLNAFKK